MSKNNAQEQIIAKLKESESILIAVNDNPSVDELSSALALTLAINNSGKHATAVASGEMPDALTFLRPEKTFEHSVDSLRDFIIALNKEKADHLRYKLVGDHVKIFITPYRSVISEKDLEFEQGDFNIDFVLALNVESQDRLDGALAAHGRIFHDASVGILTVGENQTNLNGIHWHDESASSLSEITVQIIESIGKKNLTESVATALLTGIVAETDRFSNSKVTAEIMGLASKLIASGADQQLVISKIREAEEKAGEFAVQKNAKMEEALEELSGEKEDKKQVSKTEQKRDGAFVIAHEEAKAKEESQEPEKDNEEELEESLNDLKNINTGVNAFSELEDGDSEDEETEQPQEDFKEVVEETKEEPAQKEELIPQAPVQPVVEIPTQPVEAIPAPVAEPKEAPAQEQNNDAPVQQEIQQPAPAQSVEGLVEAPIENYAPEIPASEPFENPNAFIAETPVQEQVFEPAQQTEISVPAFEAPAPTQPVEATPAPVAEPKEAPAQEQKQGDEYYHPKDNAEIVSGLMGAQPYSPSGIKREDNTAATSNPENNDYILNRKQTQNAVYEEPKDNSNFIPETNAYAQAAPVQPLSNFESSNPISNEQYAASNPVQNSNDFAMPMPPAMPDFNTMPMPPEIPNFDVAPSPAEQPAMGAQNSGDKIMTDQIYPNDPSQFRIPGM
jgi:hypothetical protein cdivTM_02431